MKDFIDIHCHILPGLDDGAWDWDMAVEMARNAFLCGTRVLFATPHTHNGLFINRRATVVDTCNQFNTVLSQNQIDVIVYPGAEVHLSPEVIGELCSGSILTLGDAGKYVLLELPGMFAKNAIKDAVRRICTEGFVPIIAHPERNRMIQNNIGILEDLIALGSLSQITGQSLLSGFGKSARKCCATLIEEDLVHFVASDAHGDPSYPPEIASAYSALENLIGQSNAHRIVFDHANRLVEHCRH